MLTIILTILITENILLLIAFIIWKTRKCAKCQQTKCIERIFNRTCWKCELSKQKFKTKEKIEI